MRTVGVFVALLVAACGDGGPKSETARAIEKIADKMCACKTIDCFEEQEEALEKVPRPKSDAEKAEIEKANEKLKKCLGRACGL